MSLKSRKKELQFHLDRSLETSIYLVKSVVRNPTLSDDERFQLLAQLINHHQSIANSIIESLEIHNDPIVVKKRLAEELQTTNP